MEIFQGERLSVCADRKFSSVQRRRLKPQDRELGNQMHNKEDNNQEAREDN